MTERTVGPPPKRRQTERDKVAYLPRVSGLKGEDAESAEPRDVAAVRAGGGGESPTSDAPSPERQKARRSSRQSGPGTPRIVANILPELKESLVAEAKHRSLTLGHAFMDRFVEHIDAARSGAGHRDEANAPNAPAYAALGLTPRLIERRPLRTPLELRLTKSERAAIDAQAQELTQGNRSALVEQILAVAFSTASALSEEDVALPSQDPVRSMD